jgi:hypothetical protein
VRYEAKYVGQRGNTGLLEEHDVREVRVHPLLEIDLDIGA